MKLSDEIRERAFKDFIEPNLKRGKSISTIRVGDLHKKLKLERQYPAVCEALDPNFSKVFEEVYRVN